MGKGPVEDHADVSHRVDAHSRASEHGAAGRAGCRCGRGRPPPRASPQLAPTPPRATRLESSRSHGPQSSHTLPLLTPTPAPASPRGGKDSVNDRVPHILGLLDKHVLWGQREELGGCLSQESQGPVHSCPGEPAQGALPTHPASVPPVVATGRHRLWGTHGAHRSESQCHPRRAQSRPAAPSGTCSTC